MNQASVDFEIHMEPGYQGELPVLHSRLPLAIHSAHGAAPLNSSPISFPHCVCKSILCVCMCIPALQIGFISAIFLDFV